MSHFRRMGAHVTQQVTKQITIADCVHWNSSTLHIYMSAQTRSAMPGELDEASQTALEQLAQNVADGVPWQQSFLHIELHLTTQHEQDA